VEITRWNTAGPTPRSTATALLTVIAAVLREAHGAVRAEDLARVLQARCGLLRVPRFVSLDDEASGVVDIAVSGGDADPEVAGRAVHLFESLTQRERALAPALADPDRWAGVLGVGRAAGRVEIMGGTYNEARAIREALLEKLRLATVNDADQEAVTLRVIALCEEGGGVG
jgi:hypothetical protein